MIPLLVFFVGGVAIMLSHPVDVCDTLPYPPGLLYQPGQSSIASMRMKETGGIRRKYTGTKTQQTTKYVLRHAVIVAMKSCYNRWKAEKIP